LDKASICEIAGQITLAKQIDLDVGKLGSKPEQDPGNACDFRERDITASNKSGY